MKTASTYLQDKVLTALGESGAICYNPNGIIAAFVELMAGRTDDDKLSEQQVSQYISTIRKIAGETPRGKKLVLSFEGLTCSGYADFETPEPTCLLGTEKKATLLKAVFPDAKILVVLRHQVSWMLSYYKQTIRESGSTLPVERALIPGVANIAKDKTVYPYVVFPCYSNLLECLSNTFGENNLTILFFENFCTNKVGFINDFYGFLGEDTQHAEVSNEVVYQGLSDSATKIARYVNKIVYCLGLNRNHNKLKSKFKYDVSWYRAYQKNHSLCKRLLCKGFWFYYRLYRRVSSVLLDRFFIERAVIPLFKGKCDLLGSNMRQKLLEMADEDNQSLLKYVAREKVPGIYLKDRLG